MQTMMTISPYLVQSYRSGGASGSTLYCFPDLSLTFVLLTLPNTFKPCLTADHFIPNIWRPLQFILNGLSKASEAYWMPGQWTPHFGRCEALSWFSLSGGSSKSEVIKSIMFGLGRWQVRKSKWSTRCLLPQGCRYCSIPTPESELHKGAFIWACICLVRSGVVIVVILKSWAHIEDHEANCRRAWKRVKRPVSRNEQLRIIVAPN